MLRFDEWPPQAGKVHFSDSSLQAFHANEEAQQNMSDSDQTIIPIRDIAYFAGKLLRANSSEFTARRIGQDLVESIDNEVIRELFTDSYEHGIRAENQALTGVIR